MPPKGLKSSRSPQILPKPYNPPKPKNSPKNPKQPITLNEPSKYPKRAQNGPNQSPVILPQEAMAHLCQLSCQAGALLLQTSLRRRPLTFVNFVGSRDLAL